MNTKLIAKTFHPRSEFGKTDLELLSVELWAEYKKILDDDHTTLYEILACYIQQREQGFKVVPIAIRLPCYLARVFKVEDHEIIRIASLGTCFLDHYTQILDDVTDLNVPLNHEMIHASHEMLLKGMVILTKNPMGNTNIGNKINQYVIEAMECERQLWPDNVKATIYGEPEYNALAKRGGVIRSAAAVYANLSGKLDMLDEINSYLLKISQAVQLLDDVTDWQEDLRQKRITSIIIAGHITINRSYNAEQYFSILLKNHAFQNNIHRAIKLLEECKKGLSIYSPKELISVIEDIIISARYSEELFTQVESVPKRERIDFISKQLKSVVGTSMMH